MKRELSKKARARKKHPKKVVPRNVPGETKFPQIRKLSKTHYWD